MKYFLIYFILFILTGCSDPYEINEKYLRQSQPSFINERDERICSVAAKDGVWTSQILYVQEAKRRGLNCSVNSEKLVAQQKNKSVNKSYSYVKPTTKLSHVSNKTIIYYSCGTGYDVNDNPDYWDEFRTRGLVCPLKSNNYPTRKLSEKELKKMSDKRVCALSLNISGSWNQNIILVKEAKKRRLNCSLNRQFVSKNYNSNSNNNTLKYNKNITSTSSKKVEKNKSTYKQDKNYKKSINVDYDPSSVRGFNVCKGVDSFF